MALLNLLQLLQSDDQVTFTDKINYNLDQILSMGGGPIGPTGFQGIQGVPGAQGIQGFQGLPGADGARWYVQLSTNLVFVPTPKLGDLWLQTDTLSIYEFLGSPGAWVSLGFTLVSPGVFTQVTNNVLFSNPNPLRSLVISPINYLGLDSPGTPNYKLKVIGTSGNPMMRFGIDDGGVETVQAFQPTISIQKLVDVTYPSSLDWKFNLDNLNGDIFFNLNGNYFGIYPQIATVSRFDFGTQTRLQNNPADRLLSFASILDVGDEFFHIGLHEGLVTTADRFLSVKNNGQLSIGDAFSNPSGSAYHTDFLEADLDLFGPPSPNHWLRLRGATSIGGTSYDMLTVTHNRLFDDHTGGPSNQSSMIRLQHDTNGAKAHFFAFTGGADNAVGLWPQMRFGYFDDYYMSGDQIGNVRIGDSAFITKYSSAATASVGSKFTVQGNLGSGQGGDTITGGSSFSGIHLIPQNFTGAQTGITSGGIGSYESTTFAGIHFQDNSGVPTVDQGMDLHIGTSVYDDTKNLSFHGEKTRMTIERFGDTIFWSKSNTTHQLIVEPGGRRDPADGTIHANDNVHIGSYDTGVWKNIILNAGTDLGNAVFFGSPANTFGAGFVGIGQYNGFGEDIVAGPNLLVGQWYLAKGGVAVHNALTYAIGIPFQAVNTTLTSGTVSLANPATKFHVNESVTFGTRKPITIDLINGGGYPFLVGLNSFTVGNNHQASTTRNIILGGAGHNTSGVDGIIIGYAGAGHEVNMTNANAVLLATTTYVSKTAPTTPLAARLFSSGNNDISVPALPYYSDTSLPMLTVTSTFPAPPGPPYFINGTLGYRGRVLVLEAQTTQGSQLTNVPVSMEFHVKNSTTSREIATIYGNYTEVISGPNTTQVGKISFATLIHTPTSIGTPTSGSLYEIANFSSNGLQFVPFADEFDNIIKPTISVELSKIPNHVGAPLYIVAGAGNDLANGATMSSVGGNLYLNAGAGGFGGAGGAILIGNGVPTSNTIIDSAAVEIHAESTGVEIHSATNTSVYGDMKFLNEVGDGTSSSSGGYQNVGRNSYAGGGVFQDSVAAVAYDRILQFVATGSPNTITAGLNETPANLGGNFMMLGRSQFYGSFTITVPAGVKVWYEADVPTGSITLLIQELKFGRH